MAKEEWEIVNGQWKQVVTKEPEAEEKPADSGYGPYWWSAPVVEEDGEEPSKEAEVFDTNNVVFTATWRKTPSEDQKPQLISDVAGVLNNLVGLGMVERGDDGNWRLTRYAQSYLEEEFCNPDNTTWHLPNPDGKLYSTEDGHQLSMEEAGKIGAELGRQARATLDSVYADVLNNALRKWRDQQFGCFDPNVWGHKITTDEHGVVRMEPVTQDEVYNDPENHLDPSNEFQRILKEQGYAATKTEDPEDE